MFGFGTKFKETSLNAFGKGVADYLHSSGEIVLISNPVEDIPLINELEEGNSSDKQVKATTRFVFDCGVIYGLAFMFLRDEEYKNLNESIAIEKAKKSMDKFIEEGLKYVSNHDYDLPEIYQNHKTIINFGLDPSLGGEDSSFNKGVRFSAVFVEEFYKVNFR